MNPEGSTIRAFLNQQAIFEYNPLLLHFLIWYLMTIVTYGTAVPAGLFLPGILVGCSLGRILGLFIETNIEESVQMATYATIGAASVLAGYSRMSFSLAVIMLETTENVNLFLPIIFALFISFTVGRIFNRSLYAASLVSKSVPFLVETVPAFNRNLRAEAIMSRPVISLAKKCKVSDIADALRDSNHNGFPVVENNSSGDQRLAGLISRRTLMVVLKNLHLVPDEGRLVQELSPPDKSVDLDEDDDEEPNELTTHSRRQVANGENRDERENFMNSATDLWKELTEDFHMSVPKFSTIA